MNPDQNQEKTHHEEADSSGTKHSIKSAQSSSSNEFQPGEILDGDYKILSLIGQGGAGSVYLVEQVFMKKRFALKILTSSTITDMSQRRFQKEAQAASRLDHPNLVRAVHFGVTAHQHFFLVMDFVEGQTLAEYLRKMGRLSVDETLKIFIPLCFGMNYAHEKGVIHRDIKPSNIVLERGNSASTFVPRVIDFGIAKLAEESEIEALTRTGEIFGTPLYMSPEQCSGIKVDNRSDIYSLGCVLYESLTGTTPFRGNTALETMMQHRNEPVLSLTEASMGQQFSPALEHMVQKMLQKDPGDRYQNCSEVANELILVESGASLSTRARTIETSAPKADGSAPLTRQHVFTYASIGIVMILLMSAVYLLQPGRTVADLPSSNEGSSSNETNTSSSRTVDTKGTKAKADPPLYIPLSINPGAGGHVPGKVEFFSELTGTNGRIFHFGNDSSNWNYLFKSGISATVTNPDGNSRN